MSQSAARTFLLPLILAVATLTASAPRLWFGGHPLMQRYMGHTSDGRISEGDDPAYRQLARYYRGQAARSSLETPFAYRIAIPALVAALPFEDVDLTFRYVNTLALILAAIAIYGLSLALGGTTCEAFWSGLFSGFSFATFWNGPSDAPDGVVLLGITLCLYLLKTDRRVAFWIACSLGMLVKEWMLLMLPIAVNWDLRRSGRVAAVRTIVLCAVPLGLACLPRYLFRDLQAYLWVPSWLQLWSNLGRPRTHVSILLTLAPAIAFAPAAIVFRDRWLPRWERAGTSLLCVALFWLAALPFYGLISAYLDGRFVWMLYPAIMPFAAAGFCALLQGGGRLSEHGLADDVSLRN